MTILILAPKIPTLFQNTLRFVQNLGLFQKIQLNFQLVDPSAISVDSFASLSSPSFLGTSFLNLPDGRASSSSSGSINSWKKKDGCQTPSVGTYIKQSPNFFNVLKPQTIWRFRKMMFSFFKGMCFLNLGAPCLFSELFIACFSIMAPLVWSTFICSILGPHPQKGIGLIHPDFFLNKKNDI